MRSNGTEKPVESIEFRRIDLQRWRTIFSVSRDADSNAFLIKNSCNLISRQRLTFSSVHSFILETYIAPLHDITTQRRGASDPS